MPNFLTKQKSSRRKKSSKVGGSKTQSRVASSAVSSGYDEVVSDFSRGVPTGIGPWELHRNEPLKKTYFFDPTTEQSLWGLPMSYTLNIPNVRGPEGDDDWTVFVDFETNRKFYTSDKRQRVQWKSPLIYKAVVKQVPFFHEDWGVDKSAKKSDAPEESFSFSVGSGSRASFPQVDTRASRSPSLEEILKSVSVEQVLEDTTACAGFHRFLVASHAEENLLFWGACEVFAKGEWKGMKVLGVEQHTPEVEDDEATMELQMQMTSTRVSKRLGNDKLIGNLSAIKEARNIYEKFLKTSSDLWVCVDMKDEKDIARAIESNDPSVENRTVFKRAQTTVLRNLAADLHPRFLSAVFSDQKLKIQSGQEFKPDEVLRYAIRRLGVSRKISF